MSDNDRGDAPYPRNPFELTAVADAYDTDRARDDQVLRWRTENGLIYPEMFGSSGGSKFFRLLELVRAHGRETDLLLEVGCGTGAFYETLRANHFKQSYTGMDASLEHIRRAREKYPDVSFSTGDAAALAFPDRCYSFVFENNVFPFLLYPEKAIREMVRVSRRLVYFNAHVTPIPCGVYAWQPIYTMATAEPGPDGTERYILPANLPPDARPDRVMPNVMRRLKDGRVKIALFKVRKHFIGLPAFEQVLEAMNVQILEKRVSKTAGYGAVMTQRLAENNSLATLLNEPDSYRITDEDVLIDVQAMDVECLLQIR